MDSDYEYIFSAYAAGGQGCCATHLTIRALGDRLSRSAGRAGSKDLSSSPPWDLVQ